MPTNEWDDPTTPIPSLDEMRYELSAKNPINLVKAAIQHMPGSAFVQGVAPIVNFPAQVAGSAIYGLGKKIFSPETADFNADTTEAMRALQYEPPSQGGRNYQEALAGALEASKLPPYIGHMPPARFNANDARVIAKQNIERAREFANIPEDFRMAQQGLQRESNLGGRTYGGALQTVAEDVGDVMARRQAQGKGAIPGVEVFSDLVPDTTMYAVRPNKSSGQIIREVPTPLNPAYAVTGDSRLSEDLADILDVAAPRTENERSYQHLDRFTNYMPEGFNQSAKDMFRNFINPVLAEEFPTTDPGDYARAVHAKYGTKANEWYKDKLEAFALLPQVKQHNEIAFKTAMSDPDIENPFEFLRDVLIIPPSAEFAGKKAADSWVMNNLQNYLVEHLATPGDPVARLIAETGKTGFDQEKMDQLRNNRRLADEAKHVRMMSGMPEEGTFQPEIDKTLDLLSNNTATISILQDRENELINANPGVRPQDIPGWKEARKEVVQATKRKDETAKKLDNLMKAQAIENYNDTQMKPLVETEFTSNIEPYFKERYPMFPSGKDLAFQMRVPSQFRDLARDVQQRLAISGAPGVKNIVKPEDVGSYSVPKAVQVKAELMHQREKMGEQAAKLAEQKLVSHIKARTESMPKDGVYGRVTAGRISKDMGEAQVKADLSDITQWMDHCIGRGGSPEKRTLSPKALSMGVENMSSQGKWRNYVPMVQAHMNNRVPAGSSGANTTYVASVLKGDSDIVDFRDTDSGIPFATLKLNVSRNEPGKFQLSEFYGYQDGSVTGPMVPNFGREYTPEEDKIYRQGIADWANDHQDQLVPTTSDYLIDNAEIYDGASPDHKSALMRAFKIKKHEVDEVLYKIDKRFVTRDEFKGALDAFKQEGGEDIESLRMRRDELEIELREAEDPDSTVTPMELDDLRYEIENLDLRIAQLQNRPPVGARAAQAPAVQDQAINDLAGNIVIRNAAFRNQMIEDIATAIRDQLLPTIESADPTIAPGRADLERRLANFQNRPLDIDLGPRIEDYILANPIYEDRIRERTADFMINQIQQRLGNGPQVEEPPELVQHNWQPVINEAREDARVQLDADDTYTLNAAIENVQDRFSFSQQPREFVQELRRRANYFEGNDRPEVANAITSVAQAYESQILNEPEAQAPATQNQMVAPGLQENPNFPAVQAAEPMRVNDAYVTVRNAHQHLINAGDVQGMQTIAERIMENRNGPYAHLNDTQRIRLRRDLYDAIDRTRAEQEPMPLADVMAMEMNRIRDNYGEEIENEVDGTLSAINDNYDIDQDPALFIERVRQHADRAHAANNLTMHDIYNHAADLLTETLRENNAIYSARARRAPVGQEEVYALDDNMLDEVASNYINNLDNPTINLIRQEADDMRNGMIDLPELRDLPANVREQAHNEIAMRMDQHSDMMGDIEATNEPPQDLTMEQAAMNEALQFPRYWYLRYPAIPEEIVTGIMTRLNESRDIEGMRVNARNRTRGTIFAGLNHNAREDAVRMLDEIGNAYQNEMNRIDNQPRQQEQYTNAAEAFNGLLEANDQFRGEEGLNTLRALPQLLDRENLREHFGTTQLSQRQRQELEQLVNNAIRQRTERPEGHKRGGLIKKNTGGKIEPTSPAPSVNDQSKPVEPIKKINNPDAPEFKDIFNHERDARKQLLSNPQVRNSIARIGNGASGIQAGGPSADIKQLMNPRNITYRKGGSINLDQMRYELTRKQ